jgi:hypothetical protein
MACATGYRAGLLALSGNLSVATSAHPMVCLLQSSFSRVQIRFKPKAGLTLVARGTLDAIGTFIKLHLVYNVLTIFEPMMALAAFDTSIIKVL